MLTDCIEWIGGKNAGGYGILTTNRKSWLAHRHAWHMQKGPIPEGLCVLHRFDNPSCINVEHLFLGTRIDNNLDCMAKGRRPPPAGERNSGAKIDASMALKIFSMKGTATQRDIGKMFGLKDSQMSRIMHGKSWKHVTATTRYAI